MTDPKTREIKATKCPQCGSEDFTGSGNRDYEADDGYWEELTCAACGIELIATYEAILTDIRPKAV
jgi:hypothetical protein